MTAAISIVRGKAEMAYVGEKPWHGLGQELTPGAPIEVWAREAGMDWKVNRSKVRYATEKSGSFREWPARHVLFRSDTKTAMSIVSDGYQIVQPQRVLEFFHGTAAENNLTLETAGTLHGGARYWALAKTGHELRVAGTDLLKGYVLLATSCDGSLATTAKFTSVRVVCQNTLSAALGDRREEIRVLHSSKFDETKVKMNLGLIAEDWKEFGDRANVLAGVKVSKKAAVLTLIKAFGDYEKFEADLAKFRQLVDPSGKAFEEQPNVSVMANVIKLFDGKARGAGLKSSTGTAWGLVNAATEYFDHAAGRSPDTRLMSAWFGGNADRKDRLVEEALKLAA